MLSDAKVKTLKPTDKPRKEHDGRGLYVYVSPAGGKLFRLDYRFAGKRKTLSLGKYPDLSLAEARQKAQDARKALAAGQDPSEQKKRAKADAEEKGRHFGAVANDWLAPRLSGFSQSYRQKVTGFLATIGDALGNRDIASLTYDDFAAAIKPTISAGHIVSAKEMCQLAARVCRYARKRGLVSANAAEGLTEDLPTTRPTHRAAVRGEKAIGKLLLDIDAYGGASHSSRYALKIAPFVFVRTSELCKAEWRELDLDAGLWTIPAERMKRRAEHVVPLSTQVVTLFRELHAITGGGAMCFPSPVRHAKSPHITKFGLNQAIRRMGYKPEEHTLHGWRTVFSTWANSTGYNRDWIEVQLAHRERNVTRAAYNRTDFLADRQRMMQDYADFLTTARETAAKDGKKQ